MTLRKPDTPDGSTTSYTDTWARHLRSGTRRRNARSKSDHQTYHASVRGRVRQWLAKRGWDEGDA